MANLSDLQTALVNADKAGDAPAARALAAEIQKMQGAQPPEKMPGDFGGRFKKALGIGKQVLEGSPLGIPSGIGEAVAQGATGSVAGPASGIAGIGSAATGLGDPASVVRGTQEALTYQPKTTVGKAVSDMGNFIPGKIEEAGEAVGNKTAEKTGSPALGAAAKTGAEMLPALLMRGVPKAAGAAAEARTTSLAQEAVANSVRNDSIINARRSGFSIPPSEYGGTIGKTLQSVSGKAKVEREFSHKNVDNATARAKIELDIPDESPLDVRTLEHIRDEAGRAYESLAKTGVMKADDPYINQVINAGKKLNQIAEDFPQAVSPEIDRLKGAYLEPEFTARGAIDATRQLRKDASQNLKNYDPEKNALGLVQREIADALEERMLRHAESIGQADLVQKFVEARRKIAKTYSVEDALNHTTGKISPSRLARQLDAGRPISGELKIIAESAKAFPRVFQDVEKFGKEGPFSPIDYFVGAAGALQNPALAGAVVARPAIRAALGSKPYQKAFAKPKTHEPGLATDIGNIMGQDPSAPSALGVGSAAMQSNQQQ